MPFKVGEELPAFLPCFQGLNNFHIAPIHQEEASDPKVDVAKSSPDVCLTWSLLSLWYLISNLISLVKRNHDNSTGF